MYLYVISNLFYGKEFQKIFSQMIYWLIDFFFTDYQPVVSHLNPKSILDLKIILFLTSEYIDINNDLLYCLIETWKRKYIYIFHKAISA